MVEKVSFVVPVYNSNPQLLSASLLSILDISNVKTEIILVDDGSNNLDTLKVEESFDQKYEEVILIKQANGGPGRARNTGLERVTGDYICFVDSDDSINTPAFAECINMLRKSEESIDIVVGLADEADRVDTLQKDEDGEWHACNNLSEASTLYKMPNVWVLWGKIYKASILKDIRFNDNLKYGEDTIFLAKIECKNVRVIRQVLYKHNKNEDSLCNKYNPNADEDFKKTISAMEEIGVTTISGTAIFRFYLGLILPLQVFNKSNKKSFNEKRMMAGRILAEEPYSRLFEDEKRKNKSRKQRLLLWLLDHRLYYSAFLLQKGK